MDDFDTVSVNNHTKPDDLNVQNTPLNNNNSAINALGSPRAVLLAGEVSKPIQPKVQQEVYCCAIDRLIHTNTEILKHCSTGTELELSMIKGHHW
jgi:hypothetical protein